MTKYEGRERPYFEVLRRALHTGLAERCKPPGVASETEIEEVIAALRAALLPFLEKVNAFLLYKAWASKRTFDDPPKELLGSVVDYAERTATSGRYARRPPFSCGPVGTTAT